jgi:hypothetical protein
MGAPESQGRSITLGGITLSTTSHTCVNCKDEFNVSATDFVEGLCLLDTEPTQALPGLVVIHDNRTNRMASAGD